MAEFTDPTLRLHPQRESDVASATLRGRTHHLRIPWGDRAQKINQKNQSKNRKMEEKMLNQADLIPKRIEAPPVNATKSRNDYQLKIQDY